MIMPFNAPIVSSKSQGVMWNVLSVHALCMSPSSVQLTDVESLFLFRARQLLTEYVCIFELNFVFESSNTWIINGVFVSNLCLEH